MNSAMKNHVLEMSSKDIDDILMRAEILEFCHDIPRNATDKTPLVVLLGWMGCKHQVLTKYSNFLEDAGYPTVRAILPTSLVFSLNVSPRRTWTADLLKFIAVIQKGCPARPVIFYAFSNGGAFVVEQLSQLFHDKKDWWQNQDCNPVRALIFDSAPCYLHVSSGAKAFGEGKTCLLRWLFVALFIGSICITSVVDPFRHSNFWRTMATAFPAAPVLHLYSADDHLCDVQELETLIARKKAAGYDLTAVRWETSKHCGHLRCHPMEYKASVLQFLSRFRA